jgi:virulence-associated protein VapD
MCGSDVVTSKHRCDQDFIGQHYLGKKGGEWCVGKIVYKTTARISHAPCVFMVALLCLTFDWVLPCIYDVKVMTATLPVTVTAATGGCPCITHDTCKGRVTPQTK